MTVVPMCINIVFGIKNEIDIFLTENRHVLDGLTLRIALPIYDILDISFPSFSLFHPFFIFFIVNILIILSKSYTEEFLRPKS